MLAQDLVEQRAVAKNFVGLNFDVGDLPGRRRQAGGSSPACGRQKRLPFGAARQQHRRAAGRQSDAVGGHGAGKDLHRVVDGQRGDHAAAGQLM